MTHLSNINTAANDNVPGTYEAYVDSLPIEPNKGRCINVIADDIEPTVARNVALYYEQKEEAWADALAGRLRSAARRQEHSDQDFRRAA